MDKRVDKEKEGVQSQEPLSVSPISRRIFLQIVGAAPLAGAVESGGAATSESAYFTIVNHWHQCGVGWLYREGTVGGKRYHQAFSIFHSVQKTIDALNQFPWLSICLEFDSHAYEAIQEEDAQFVREKFRPLVAAGRIDIVGGTYSQPYAQLLGMQSNVRQLVEGRAVVRDCTEGRRRSVSWWKKSSFTLRCRNCSGVADFPMLLCKCKTTDRCR